MPRYDFSCGDCGNIFELTISMSDYTQEYVKSVRCPYCGGGRISREYTPPAISIQKEVSSKTLKNLDKIMKHKNRTSSSEYAI